MQVFNNVPAFGVWVNYTNSVSNMRDSMGKLSSGLRIVSAGDDPAGLAMSERMRSQIRNSSQASQNIQNNQAYMRTADSWMQKIHDMLHRMNELAVSANDGTKTDVDRANLQVEFQQMQEEIIRITSGSLARGKFNTANLFDGRGGLITQVGPDPGQFFCGSALSLHAGSTHIIGRTLTSWPCNGTNGTGETGGTGGTTGPTEADRIAAARAVFETHRDAAINFLVAGGNNITISTNAVNAGIDALVAAVAAGTPQGDLSSGGARDGYDAIFAIESGGADLALNMLLYNTPPVGGADWTAGDPSPIYADAVAAFNNPPVPDVAASVGIEPAGVISTVTWGSLLGRASAVTGTGGINISTQAQATRATAFLRLGIDHLSRQRATIGAEMRRLAHTLDGLRTYEENIRSAESQIRDVDMARESTNFTKHQILTQVGTAMLAQANALPQNVLQLIG